MRVLFIHQNFPGQLRHIALHLAKKKDFQIAAIGRDTAPGLPGIRILRYTPRRKSAPQTHPYLRPFEEAVLHGQQVMRILLDLKSKGYHPDVILAHPGWGETLYAKDVFPSAKLVHFCEYYYHSKGADAGFDPEFPINDDGVARIRSRNALHLLNLENCDVGVTPTHWQHSLHPAAYQPKIKVIHEGINTDLLGPDPSAILVLPCGKVMRSLPKILREDERCEIIIIGGDGVSYGASPVDARSWREKMLRENAIDAKRVHFLGRVSYSEYIRVLQVSAVHVYLTYPFVLSWSFLETMACGCTLVGSDTPPVTEVLTEENGVIVDFIDINGLAVKVAEMLSERKTNLLKLNAMETAKTFSVAAGVVGYSAIIEV